jgi:hypothetical protein
VIVVSDATPLIHLLPLPGRITMSPTELLQPVTLTDDERQEAQWAARRLCARRGLPMQMQIIEDDRPPETVAIPAPAARLLTEILTEMAQGNAVTLIPIHAQAKPPEPGRDPALVARVKSIRGRLALPSGAELASQELHRERQMDKEKEEQQLRDDKP